MAGILKIDRSGYSYHLKLCTFLRHWRLRSKLAEQACKQSAISGQAQQAAGSKNV
jgi:hypothetical protein